jgi:hypothetical protein
VGDKHSYKGVGNSGNSVCVDCLQGNLSVLVITGLPLSTHFRLLHKKSKSSFVCSRSWRKYREVVDPENQYRPCVDEIVVWTK